MDTHATGLGERCTPVVDYALSYPPEIRPVRIALTGWSFRGYLAPRPASEEHRLAACTANGFSLPKETLKDVPNIDPSFLEPIMP